MPANPVITIGFDPSLNATGWAVLEDNLLKESGVLRFPTGGDADVKLDGIVQEAAALLNRFHPQIVAIEEERVFRSTTAVVVGQVIGALKAVIMCVEWPIQLCNVHPSTARALLGFSSKKADIVRKVKMINPSFSGTHHEADAFAVANAAYYSSRSLV